MAKFKVLLKVKELEVSIEGERDALPQISQGLQKQVAGLLTTPIEIAVKSEQEPARSPATTDTRPLGKVRQRRNTAPRTDGAEDTTPIEFKHDINRFGSPKQQWSTTQKIIWLLHIVAQQTAQKELSHSAIIATFNQHFRQSGALNRGNSYRDLGKAKLKTPPLVGEDSSQTPSKWYLTDEGKKQAEALVSAAKGEAVLA